MTGPRPISAPPLSDRPLSVARTLAGQEILLCGGTGFLGKVWLSMLLHRIPEVGRVHVLVRRRRGRSGLQRFEESVGHTPAFAPLHERHGAALGAWMAGKVSVVEGDLSLPDLGLPPEVLERLRERLDLVVNCAGLVDFEPPLSAALETNVRGALHLADLVRSCARARLVHVSTTYVAGNRQGRIPEELRPEVNASGAPWEPAAELRAGLEAAARIAAEHGIDPAARPSGRPPKALVRALEDEGRRRARAAGFPNTYTWSKALAEALVGERMGDRPWTSFRPAIVESAVDYPFAGWNEGFNTSGPIVYLLGTWFRHLPTRPGHPFDVVPVDMVCRGLLVASAALLEGRHLPVYHCATSDRNRLTLPRAVELSALGQRRHLLEGGEAPSGTPPWARRWLARLDGTTAPPDHLLSPGNLRRVARGAGRKLRGLTERSGGAVAPKLARLADLAERSDRQLGRMERVLRMYLPFIHDNHHLFEATALDALPVVEADLRFDPEGIDWRRYWLDVHMPGMRRFTFPLFEGREPEGYTPEVPFRLAPAEPGAELSAAVRAAGEGA